MVTVIWERSAIWQSEPVGPLDPSPIAAWPTEAPVWALNWMMLPAAGARTVRCSACSTALS